VTVARLDSKYYHGSYLLPLNLSLGVKGNAEVAVTGKSTAGKNISALKSFGYGRLNKAGGRIACGKLTLEVPADALEKPELITLVPGDDPGPVSAKAAPGEVELEGASCLVGPASLKSAGPLTLGIGAEDLRGAGIYRLTEAGPVFLGGESRNGSVTARISGGGTFRLGYDRTPPRVGRPETGERSLALSLSDGGSGVDGGSIRVSLDSSPVSWRYDEVRSLLTVDLPEAAAGESLEISVSDRSGNTARE
jgi:hypothetical protein